MTVSREAMTWGYRLGREPESEQAILSHLNVKDEMQLADSLLRSKEFAAKRRIPVTASVALDTAPIEVEVDATPEQLAGCLAKIKEAWAHLGFLRPHFSVLTNAVYLPTNLHQSIATCRCTACRKEGSLRLSPNRCALFWKCVKMIRQVYRIRCCRSSLSFEKSNCAC